MSAGVPLIFSEHLEVHSHRNKLIQKYLTISQSFKIKKLSSCHTNDQVLTMSEMKISWSVSRRTMVNPKPSFEFFLLKTTLEIP